MFKILNESISKEINIYAQHLRKYRILIKRQKLFFKNQIEVLQLKSIITETKKKSLKGLNNRFELEEESENLRSIKIFHTEKEKDQKTKN